MTTVEQLTECGEMLSVTENPDDLEVAYGLFQEVLDLFHLTYFNPGEPETWCEFCGRSRALPGAYGEDVYTGKELEDPDFELPGAVYWARVWAVRALDILDPAYVEDACCLKRDELWATLEL